MDARIQTKRIYAPVTNDDGCRILVDRLWPRGLRKTAAAIDHWFKTIAPSDELRRWFGHDPDRFAEFRRRYRAELDANTAAVAELLALARQHDTLTLLYAARNTEHNHALVLAEYLAQQHA